MVRTRFIYFFLVFLCAVTYAGGQVIISPGTQYTLSNNPATGGTSGTNGNFTFVLSSNHDLNTRTLRAQAQTSAVSLGTGTASAQIYYDFEVGSTPGTEGNTVGAWINYVVTWAGNQAILATGASNSTVEVDLVLRDITGSRNLHFEPIHELDLQTYRYKVIVAGIAFNDSGAKPNTFPAVLVRGHTYRLTLRLSTSVFLLAVPATGSFAESRYFIDGILLNSLNVKAGLDEREVADRFTGIDNRLTNIENRLVLLENHRHIYLTGRGTGHNNTEASSSLPILGSTPAVPPSEDVSSPPVVPGSDPATKPEPAQMPKQ